MIEVERVNEEKLTVAAMIKVLYQIKELLLMDKSWLKETYDPIRQTFDTAIKSLKGWDKVRAEILDLKNAHMIHFVSPEGLIDTVVEIIDKHLSEVSE